MKINTLLFTLLTFMITFPLIAQVNFDTRHENRISKKDIFYNGKKSTTEANLKNHRQSIPNDDALIYRDIGDVQVLDLANGIYGTFPLIGPFTINQISTNSSEIYTSDFDGNNILYGLANNNGDTNLVTIDVLTGITSIVTNITGLVSGETPSGLSWNPVNETMYALSTNGTTTTLYTLDTQTGVLSSIGPTGNTGGIWIAIDNNGICYMADVIDDQLYSINLNTGVASPIGNLGVDLNFAQEADVDTATNSLYMAGYRLNGSEVYSINVLNGLATNLGPVTNGGELTVFAIEGPPVFVDNFICDDARPIPLGITNSDGPVNTSGGASNICLTGAADAVWYSYTSGNTGNLTITSDLASNSGIDTRVSIYNDDCNNLICIGSDDNSGTNNSSTVIVPVVSGTTYLIEWDDANDEDQFYFELSLDVFCPDPSNFEVTAVTTSNADFSWDVVAQATNGYTLSVFEGGVDPNTGTPVYTGNIPSGTTTATATGLMGTTLYDAYLTADCDTNGFSNDIMISFNSAIDPPVCGGKFYDTGGPNENYENNEDYSVIIAADDPAHVVKLDFLSVDIESFFDVLHIYDGDDANAPELSDPVDGVREPGIFSSNIPGGNLYITFTSDPVENRAGWDANVICELPPACPAPLNFALVQATESTANLSWDLVPNASNGYIFSIFNSGDDPSTDTPVYTENITNGINTATATGLTQDTLYDAYVVSDCDSDGLSLMSMLTIRTAIAPLGCGDQFIDSGGINGEYQNNESRKVTILPDNSGEGVTVTFTYVDIEVDGNDCFDFLTIYDGPNINSPVLAQMLCSEESGDGDLPSSDHLLSVGDSFSASDPSNGALTIVFTSDEIMQETGWVADVSCALLSIDDLTTSGFNYFPNPATNRLSVKAKQFIESIDVFDMLGQKVLSFYPKAKEAILDFSKLSSGTYIMKSTINENFYVNKIIKK